MCRPWAEVVKAWPSTDAHSVIDWTINLFGQTSRPWSGEAMELTPIYVLGGTTLAMTFAVILFLMFSVF